MKRFSVLLVSYLALTSSQCKKESQCHHTISWVNNSNTSVYFARNTPGRIMCYLGGGIYRPGDTFVDKGYSHCWEDVIGDSIYTFYVVDTSKFNTRNGRPYPCDSLELYNKILKVYSLSLQELKDRNFMVVYQ